MKTARNANIELLRILMMLLIVFTHLRWLYLPVDTFTGTEFPVWKLLALLCNFHVDVFVLITGYFGLKTIMRPFVKIFTYSYFYILLLSIVFWYYNSNIDWSAIIFPVTESPWWFIKTYFLLILFAPILEYAYKDRTTTEKVIITTILTVINIYWSFCHHTEGLYNRGFDIITFVNLYSIGQLLRLDTFRLKLSRKKLATLFIMFEILNIVFAGVQHNFDISISVGDYSNPISMVIAVVVFLFMVNTHIGNSKIITWLAESAFAVYMITEFPESRAVLKQIVTETLPANSYMHIVYTILFVPIVYFLCTLIDKIRIGIFNIMESTLKTK